MASFAHLISLPQEFEARSAWPRTSILRSSVPDLPKLVSDSTSSILRPMAPAYAPLGHHTQVNSDEMEILVSAAPRHAVSRSRFAEFFQNVA